jgi:hypothetical protein
MLINFLGTLGIAAAAVILKNLNFFLLKLNIICIFWIVFYALMSKIIFKK